MQTLALECAGCDHIYIDHGVSGIATKREGLDKLLADLREGDALFVWRLDRLGRSLSHLVEMVKELEDRGVSFCSLKEALDTRTPVGRLCFHIIAAISEYEREMNAERSKAGMQAARERGVQIGRPRKLSAVDVKRISTALAAGSPLDSLAASYGVHPRTVYRALETCDETIV